MAYTDFAAQLEALRNGVPSAEVFAGGMAGGQFTPAPGTNMGQNLDAMYQHQGIDPNRNYAMEQLAKAFPGADPTENFYTAKYGSHLATDAQGNTKQLAFRPAGLGGGGAGSGGAGGVGGGAGGGGMGNPPAAASGGGYGLGSNPYQGAQADALAAQQQTFLDRNLAGIRSNSVGVGGLGGSRQGVAQGEAIGSAATGLAGATANLYGANYNADQNRELQRYGYDQGFYTANRGLDQSGAALGANLYGLANSGDWSGLQNANGVYGTYKGYGTDTASSQQGGGWQGGLGGALSGLAFGQKAGWWG